MAGVLGRRVSKSSWFRGLVSMNGLTPRSFCTQIFVSRLSFYTTDQSLRETFSPFGNVLEARLVMDKKTLRPKGFGFVTYESEVEAQKAIKAMDGRILDGRLIFVEFAKPRSEGEAGS